MTVTLLVRFSNHVDNIPPQPACPAHRCQANNSLMSGIIFTILLSHLDTATDTTVTVTETKQQLNTETTEASPGKGRASLATMATRATQSNSPGSTSSPLPMATAGLALALETATSGQNLLPTAGFPAMEGCTSHLLLLRLLLLRLVSPPTWPLASLIQTTSLLLLSEGAAFDGQTR